MLSRRLEITALSPTLSAVSLDSKLSLLKSQKASGIILPSFWLKKAVRELEGFDVSIVTVVGFPFGNQHTSVKVHEAKLAIEEGCTELLLVFHHSAFASGMTWPKIEVAQLAKLAHEEGCLLSIMIEPEWITSEDEVLVAARMAQEAGADFIALGTGIYPSLPSIELITKLRADLSSQVGIKLLAKEIEPQLFHQFFTAGVDLIGLDSL